MTASVKKHIWIVEDHPGAQFLYKEILGRDYRLELFSDLASFSKKLASKTTPDLIIADLGLDNENFLDFLQSGNSHRLPDAPFMVVSSFGDEDILRDCFKLGAVDYLIKPFTKSELVVKVERIVAAAGKRQKPSEKDREKLLLDAAALTVRRGSRSTLLTAKELRIFSMLYEAQGDQVSRKKLESEVWGKSRLTSKNLDVHLFNLRKKLSRLGAEIRFMQPGGYALSEKRE